MYAILSIFMTLLSIFITLALTIWIITSLNKDPYAKPSSEPKDARDNARPKKTVVKRLVRKDPNKITKRIEDRNKSKDRNTSKVKNEIRIEEGPSLQGPKANNKAIPLGLEVKARHGNDNVDGKKLILAYELMSGPLAKRNRRRYKKS